MKSAAASLLRYGLGIALLGWLLATGKLQLTPVWEARRHYWLLLATAALSYLQFALAARRWMTLLRASGARADFRSAFSLTLLGALFNTVMPGSVGGDVMKAYAAAKRTGAAMLPVATSILVDRLIGLWALLSLSALGALVNSATMRSHSSLFRLWPALWVGVIGGLAAFLPLGRKLERTPFGRVIQACPKLIRAVWEKCLVYQDHPGAVARAFALSAACHACAFGAYLAALAAAEAPTPPAAAFCFLVPLAFLVTALPLSPSGIGVGQAAVYFLFDLYTGNGAPAAAGFTIYQAALLAVYLSGGPLYLLLQRETQFPAPATVPSELARSAGA